MSTVDIPCRLPTPPRRDRGIHRVLAEDYQPVLSSKCAQFEQLVMTLGSVDAITVELVRLRCAQLHNCRMCATLRWDRAQASGFDESWAEKVQRYEASDLSDAHKAALRFVDAFTTIPGDIGASVRDELRRHFTDRQIVELALFIAKFSVQKVHVSLAIDAPPSGPDVVFDVDAEGKPFRDDSGGLRLAPTRRGGTCETGGTGETGATGDRAAPPGSG